MSSPISHSKPTINSIDLVAVKFQLNEKNLANGSKVQEFEKLIGVANDVSYALCTSSGSSALQVCLLALKMPIHSEIILPSYVCKSVYDAVRSLGFIPVLCDIGSNWVMTEKSIRSKITNKTAAIILVHTFGIDAWNDELNKLNIPIIEDLCQGFALQKYTHRPLKGIMGFCSFNATKCLTTGEGGAVITNSVDHYNRSTQIIKDKLVSTIFSDYQAALGIAQLKQYPEFVEARKKIAKRYINEINDKSNTENFSKTMDKSVCFRFVLSGNYNVDAIIEKAGRENIAIRRGVDKMLHSKDNLKDFDETIKTFNSTLSLPIYPSLSNEEQDRVIKFINSL